MDPFTCGAGSGAVNTGLRKVFACILTPSCLEENRNTDVWVREEGLEKCQRGNGTGGDKSWGRAGGCGAGGSLDLTQDGWVRWGEREKRPWINLWKATGLNVIARG